MGRKRTTTSNSKPKTASFPSKKTTQAITKKHEFKAKSKARAKVGPSSARRTALRVKSGSQIAFRSPPATDNGRQSHFPLSKIARGIAGSLGAPKWVDSALGWGIPALGRFTGLPIGAQTGAGAGVLSNTPAGQLIGAPATVGLVTRTPNWDFGRAPDIGCGPGIRVSGRLIFGYVIDGYSETSERAYIGLGPSENVEHPMPAVALSPVRGYVGDNSTCPAGAYGAADNILQDMAECWTRYRLVDCCMVYQPFCSTGTNKSVSIAWVPDAQTVLSICNEATGDTGSAANVKVYEDDAVVLGIPNSVTTPAWAPTTFVIPCDANSTDLLYVSSDRMAAPGIKVNQDDEQARFLFPGGILITGFGADSEGETTVGKTLGCLFCDLTYDLYQLAVNTLPTFVTPETPTRNDESKVTLKTQKHTFAELRKRRRVPVPPPFPQKLRRVTFPGEGTLGLEEEDTIMVPVNKRAAEDSNDPTSLKKPTLVRSPPNKS
jgi:hypothetical protein